MRCPPADELYRSMSEGLSRERQATLSTHLSQCQACAGLFDELRAIGLRLRPSESELPKRDIAGEVMTLIRLGRAEPRRAAWSWMRWFAFPAVAMAGAAAALLLVPTSTLQPSFQARGVSAPATSRWVSVEAFRVDAAGNRPLGSEMYPGDAIAFRYLNRSPEAMRYLMIFAVDEAGRLFWYYPAQRQADENGQSIEIQRAAEPLSLPEAVRHQLLPGKLRFFAVFTERPLQVFDVRRQVEADLATAGHRLEALGRLNIDRAGQHTFVVRVLESPPQR